ncbi:metallophosphoesterase family protein [Thiohalomonas denitrificans]|uniref:metallophosphoesterase family protein n=1 Tax=Thiohalomonas denitrificans TaxID=415747 RepID=UPI0026E9D3F6|nr:YfcE family phosphodiesterase [Thiohalomonas denitrificans]
MKICIVSDSHDNRPFLKAAVEEAKSLGAEAVLHCGDVVAPTALRPLQAAGLPVHVIHGNNEGDTYAMFMLAQEPGSVIFYHGMDAGLELGGRHIFLVHFPHYAQALATTGDWDVVCCGHDHRPAVTAVENIKGKTSWMINPGTVAGVGPRATYIMGDLETLEFEIRDVPGV